MVANLFIINPMEKAFYPFLKIALIGVDFLYLMNSKLLFRRSGSFHY
jgi:hypothetical protein